jgi:predicted ester cyclase
MDDDTAFSIVSNLRGSLHTIEELVAEGDTVVGRMTMAGTHQGYFMGFAPTGRSVQQAQVHFVRYLDGKAIEHRGVRDDLSLMQQLGVSPTQEHGGR